MSQFKIDKSGKLKKFFEHSIKKEYEELSCLKFFYTWRYKEKFDDGQTIVAEISKMSNRDRDLFGYDVRVEVCKKSWVSLHKNEKIKVVYHELAHLEISYEDLDEDEDINDEELEKHIKTDKEGRVVFYTVDHDVVIRRFESELMKYGLSSEEDSLRKKLNKIYKKIGLSET